MIDLENDPELKKYFDKIPFFFERYWNKCLDGDKIPLTDVGWEIETRDKVYQIKVNVREIDKHTCDECIYWDNKCLKEKDKSSIEYKIHCNGFEGTEYCYHCKHYKCWNSEDYLCDYFDTDFEDYEYLHMDSWNSKNRCPKFEVDIGK